MPICAALMRASGARSGPPLKPISQPWYFQMLRGTIPVEATTGLAVALLALRMGALRQYRSMPSSQVAGSLSSLSICGTRGPKAS